MDIQDLDTILNLFIWISNVIMCSSFFLLSEWYMLSRAESRWIIATCTEGIAPADTPGSLESSLQGAILLHTQDEVFAATRAEAATRRKHPADAILINSNAQDQQPRECTADSADDGYHAGRPRFWRRCSNCRTNSRNESSITRKPGNSPEFLGTTT
jgi:hypothetical protein